MKQSFHTKLPDLGGFCDHTDIKHDGTTLWLLADVNPTLKVYKWIPAELRWILVFDLLRDVVLPPNMKLGLGHSIEVGPYNVHLAYILKDTLTGITDVWHLGLEKTSLG
jgi:hypothetical protein